MLEGLESSGTPPSRGVRRPAALLAAAAAVIVVAAGVTAYARRGDEPVMGLATPIAVTPLRNETGDSTLAIWGRLAADWLTQGLHETALASVVPWPTVRQAWETLDRADTPVSAMSVAAEIGARSVVGGFYYLTGDRVAFRLDISDVDGQRLIASIPPIVVRRDSLEQAVREMRGRLMGFVALQFYERAPAFPGLAARPPTFDAYRAFDRGLALYNEQEYGAAAAEFRQAWSADTSFPVPLIYAAMAHWNRDEYARVDTLVAIVRARRDRLGEYDRLQLEYITALLANDGERAISAGTQAVAIAPEPRAAYNLGRDLIAMNRAAEGRRVLEGIDPDRGLMKGWPSYWTQLCHARHLTGAHDLELAAARAMRQRFPESRLATVLEARALAASGDTAGLRRLLAETAAMPSGTYWSHGAALVVAGEELTAHHDSALGFPYLREAAAWLEGALAAEPGRREHRYWLGSALYDLARWRQADSVFAGLHRDFPDRFQYQGLAAVARARVGDTTAARRILGRPPAHGRGEHTEFLSRLAAIAGDTASARAHAERALAEMSAGYAWLHAAAFRDLPPVDR